MKQVKKILALVLVAMMILSLSVTAFGDGTEPVSTTVNITIKRDKSYDDTAGTGDDHSSAATGDRDFYYYKVFDANYTSNKVENTQDAKDTFTQTPEGGAVTYTIPYSDSRLSSFGTWSTTEKKWTRATGNNWFDFYPSADGTVWIVSADKDFDTAAEAKDAAKWLVNTFASNDSAWTQMTISSDKKSWTATVDKGYYLIKSSEGENLVAATTDIEVVEKNTYPTIDKKQKDEDKTAYQDAAVSVKVGDTISYQVVVYVPADANQDIVVTDKMSTGLAKKSDFSVTVKAEDPASGAAPTTFTTTLNEKSGTPEVTNYTIDTTSSDGWTATIKPTTETKGKFVEFTFEAVVTDVALADTGKRNEVKLQYNNTHYEQTDYVEFETYATGIVKFDGDKGTLDTSDNKLSKKGDADYQLKDAEFKLQVKNGTSWVDLPVASKTSDGYYRTLKDGETAPNPTVALVSDDNGQIIIRGLDNDKQYQLVETKAPTGFNLAKDPVPLTLTKDEKAKVAIDEATDDDTDDTVKLDAASVKKVENKTGTILPSTGGIGTTIFYVVGGILVAAAAIVLITKRRMAHEE